MIPDEPRRAGLDAPGLAGLPVGERIRALESRGATPPELAWLVTQAGPRLVRDWARIPFARALRELAGWTRKHLRAGEAVVPLLFTPAIVPPEALGDDPTLAERLGLIPAWIRPRFEDPFRLAFRPGEVHNPLDLRPWSGHVLDLEIRGPQPGLRLPGSLRVRQRLHIGGMEGLVRLHVQDCADPAALCEVEDCGELREVEVGPGAVWVTLRRCPRLRRLDLAGTGLRGLAVEDCPSLRSLEIPAPCPAWGGLDIAVRRCPGLVRIGGEGPDPLRLRNLDVEACPALRIPRGSILVSGRCLGGGTES